MMETESDSYFDLSFGKCSQMARRNDENLNESNKENNNIFISSQNNQIPADDFITCVKPRNGTGVSRCLGETNTAMNYSHHSYSKYLIGRAQRDFSQHNNDTELKKENPISSNVCKSKQSLWNDINIMSARELPHPRNLRKKKKNGVVKEEKKSRSTSRLDHGMAVENHLKQLKFYCSRVSREVPTGVSNHLESNRMKSITLDDVEIPPLPETPALYPPVRREMFESFNIPVSTALTRDRDQTPGFDRILFPQSDCLSSFQTLGPVTFQSTSRRLNFDQCSSVCDWNSDQLPDECITEEEGWVRKNWHPRYVSTPDKEE